MEQNKWFKRFCRVSSMYNVMVLLLIGKSISRFMELSHASADPLQVVVFIAQFIYAFSVMFFLQNPHKAIFKMTLTKFVIGIIFIMMDSIGPLFFILCIQPFVTWGCMLMLKNQQGISMWDVIAKKNIREEYRHNLGA